MNVHSSYPDCFDQYSIVHNGHVLNMLAASAMSEILSPHQIELVILTMTIPSECRDREGQAGNIPGLDVSGLSSANDAEIACIIGEFITNFTG